MTRILQFGLTGVCAGLSLIIAAELFPLTEQNNFPAPESAARTSPPIETAGQALYREALVAAILERPLFIPGRHPPQIVSFAPIAETPGEAPPQLRGRLAGVTIRPGVREALFMREGQKSMAVNVGGIIDGWRISAIEPDRVTLSSPFGSQTIKPTNDPRVVHPPVHPIGMGIGMAPSGVSIAPTAGARGNLANRTASAASPATPNPIQDPLQLAAQTGRRGP